MATTQDPNPLSVYYMEQVLEEKPSKSQRLGPRIFGQYLPIRNYGTYRIVWEKVREYSPMPGLYALEDLPGTFDTLDFETYQSDVLHWGIRQTLTAKEIMFLRWAGESNITNAKTGYGTGPAADDYRRKDAAKIAEYTQLMNEALDSLMEYLRVSALAGHIWWPPKDENGNDIAAASLPISMGRQKLNHPVPFRAATSSFGAFHQSASTLTGVSGGVSATGKAWNDADANPILDMAVISDLLEESISLTVDNLELIMAKRVLVHMANNSNVLNWILGNNRDRQFMTVNEIRDFITNRFDWSIRFYQSKWEYVKQDELGNNKPTVHQVPFLSYGTVLIIPKPDVMDFGVLATAPAPGPAHNWREGKYMWMTRDEKPPWKTEMGMGGYWWPLIFDTDVRFRLDAWS